METTKRVPFKRQDQAYFNCIYSEMFSYLKHKNLPIELLLYNCLEEPDKINDEMIVNGKTRWSYPFHIFSEHALRALGLELHSINASFAEAKGIVKSLVDKQEVVFTALNSYYIPHREEYQKRKVNHWIMITDYDTDQFMVLDEVLNQFIYYDYDEKTIETAYNNSRGRFIYFAYSSPDYNNLKGYYIDFFRNFRGDSDGLFHSFHSFLTNNDSSITLEERADRIFTACHFFAGSMKVFKSFLLYIEDSSDVIQHLDQVIKASLTISSIVKKYELTKEINFELIIDNVELMRQSYQEVTNYIKSNEFLGYLNELPIEQVVNNQLNKSIEPAENARTNERAEFIPIDLESHFNNQAFGTSDSFADFTGGGEFFLLDEDCSLSDMISCNRIPYMIASELGSGNDNISCNAQTINIEDIECDGLWLLGCGEWGDACSDLSLYDEDDLLEQVSIQLTDWAWTPKYNDEIVYSGQIFRREKLEFTPEKGHLFTLYVPLKGKKKLRNIRLPVFPNLHIFALTLSNEVGSKSS